MPEVLDPDPQYAGFGVLVWPPVWCASAPGAATRPALTELVAHRRLDVGLEVAVSREGVVVFDFRGWEPTRKPPRPPAELDELRAVDERRVAVANAWLAALHTAILAGGHVHHKQVVAPGDVVHVARLDQPQNGVYLGRPRTATAAAMWNADDSALVRIAEAGTPPGRSLVVPVDALGLAADLLQAVLATGGVDGARLASLYLRSAKSTEDEEYGLGLIVAWALCERMLTALWTAHLQAAGHSKTRIRKLTGRDWTISVLIESLELAGRLDPELTKRLHVTRKLRNAWAHDLRVVSQEDATQAVELAGAMLREVAGLPLQVVPFPVTSVLP